VGEGHAPACTPAPRPRELTNWRPKARPRSAQAPVRRAQPPAEEHTGARLPAPSFPRADQRPRHPRRQGAGGALQHARGRAAGGLRGCCGLLCSSSPGGRLAVQPAGLACCTPHMRATAPCWQALLAQPRRATHTRVASAKKKEKERSHCMTPWPVPRQSLHRTGARPGGNHEGCWLCGPLAAPSRL